MTVRKIDQNGDWTFGKGRNNYIRGNDEVSQNVTTRLRSFLGDCFFALNDGVDWFNILGTSEEVTLRLAVSTTILNTKDIVKLEEVNLIKDDNRKLTIQYVAISSFGEIDSTVSIGDI